MLRTGTLCVCCAGCGAVHVRPRRHPHPVLKEPLRQEARRQRQLDQHPRQPSRLCALQPQVWGVTAYHPLQTALLTLQAVGHKPSLQRTSDTDPVWKTRVGFDNSASYAEASYDCSPTWCPYHCSDRMVFLAALVGQVPACRRQLHRRSRTAALKWPAPRPPLTRRLPRSRRCMTHRPRSSSRSTPRPRLPTARRPLAIPVRGQ